MSCRVSPVALADAQGKKALLIVAPSDFEPTEYSTTRSTLESGGMTCTVASTKTGSLKSAKGTRAQSDLILSEVQTGDYDAIVVIGGNGIKKLWMNEDAHRIVREAAEQDKVVAAICAGPGVLAYSGVMQGKKGTAHPKSGAPRRPQGKRLRLHRQQGRSGQQIHHCQRSTGSQIFRTGHCGPHSEFPSQHCK